ncbi:MAG: NAD(+) synthase [Cytophagales bacterium]|nr:MAG: NAD(+) synthase [Cytophagales bacterium]
MNTIRIAGATLNQTPIDWKNNTKHILLAIEEAKKQKVEILCLPELAITGYGCEDLFLSKWLPEKALKILLEEILPHTQNIWLAIGIPLVWENELYNCAAVIHNQQIIGITAKQFLALDGVHYEPRWFKAWEKNKVTHIQLQEKNIPLGDLQYQYKDIKIGIEICEDAWHGEKRPAITHCQEGAKLILGLNASHFAFGKLHIRQQLVTDICQRFEAAYLYVNLLGNEAGKMIYGGDIIIGQANHILQRNERFSFQDFNLTIADVDFEKPNNSSTPTPLVEDAELENVDFTKAVTLALFDYLRKSRSKGYVLSLSGGADSSTCAVLVAEMIKRGIAQLGVTSFAQKLGVFSPDQIKELGQEKEPNAYLTKRLLSCAYQAARSSSEATLRSAKELADSLHAAFYDWSIAEEVASYTQKIENALQRPLTWETDDITLQNIQARARSPIIWMLTNVKNFLLITTSNRSEGSVGYATMDGDTSGSISPIAGVDKHFIRQWLLWAETHLGYGGLQRVNSLAPSAELRPQDNAQTDEKDLMPYHILQAIEELAVRNHQSPKEVFEQLVRQNLEEESLLKMHIKKFYTLWSRNQWKRERLAPSFHLDDYNVDPRSWCRFPILSGSFQEELAEL